MSDIIRLAESRDIDAICTLLHTRMNARIPVDRWRHLMTYPWLDNKPDFGRVVESGGQILGYCGLVYSDRILSTPEGGQRTERFVSMSSWYLDKSLRGRGLGKGLLAATIEDSANKTFTQFTNSPKPMAIVAAMGFRLLDEYRYHWKKTGLPDSRLLVIESREMILLRANAVQRQLLEDMKDMPIKPLWLEFDNRQALVFFSIKHKGEHVLWYDLLYTSDPELFTDCAQLLANQLLPVDAPSVMATDSRLVKQPDPEVVRERLPIGRHFMSDSVRPHEIDLLYSELQLLDLKLD